MSTQVQVQVDIESSQNSPQAMSSQVVNSPEEEKPDLFFSCKSSLDLDLVRVQIEEEDFNSKIKIKPSESFESFLQSIETEEDDIGKDEKTIELNKFPPKKDNFVVDQCSCDWWVIGIALFLLVIFVILIFFELSCNCLQNVFQN